MSADPHAMPMNVDGFASPFGRAISPTIPSSKTILFSAAATNHAGPAFPTPAERTGKAGVCSKGSIFSVAVDIRKGSPSYGQCVDAILSEKGEQLFVPPGFAQAYCTLEAETLVAYKVTEYYNKDAEGGLRFEDPALDIHWRSILPG